MAAYAVSHAETNTFSNPDDALNALEAIIDTITNTKTLRLVDIVSTGNAWKGVIIYDA